MPFSAWSSDCWVRFQTESTWRRKWRAEAAAGWWFCAVVLCSVTQLKAVFQQAVSAQVMLFFPEILLGCILLWCRVSRWKEAERSSCRSLVGLAVYRVWRCAHQWLFLSLSLFSKAQTPEHQLAYVGWWSFLKLVIQTPLIGKGVEPTVCSHVGAVLVAELFSLSLLWSKSTVFWSELQGRTSVVAQDYMLKIREDMEVSFHVTVCSLAAQTSVSFMCAVFEMIAFCIEKPKLYSLAEV